MHPSVEILRERLAELIVARHTTARALSIAIGANHSYVSQLISGKGGMPSAGRLQDIARMLDTTVDYLTGAANTPDIVRSEVSVADHRLGWRGASPTELGIPLVGTGDCADMEVVTDSGEHIWIERSSFDSEFHIRYIERPPALRGDKSAYAIYFHGSSMEPRFFAGEVGIVQPSRPASPGDYVVIQLNNGESDDVVTVLVKRLVRQSSTEVVLEQHNPPMTFTLPRRKVAHIHRIIPPTEQLLR